MSDVTTQIAEQIDVLITRAYQSGFRAGQAHPAPEIYRRGYLAGYGAGKRRAPYLPDGGARTGRPRKELQSVVR